MSAQSTKNEENESTAKRLVRFLYSLAPEDTTKHDRAALAYLRRGIGRDPRHAMEMYPYLGDFFDDDTSDDEMRAIFLTATLFAYYWNAPNIAGNLGASLKLLNEDTKSEDQKGAKNTKPKVSGIEKRYLSLLDADAENLYQHLFSMIGLLKSSKSEKKPVNWIRLFNDIQYWNLPDRQVQLNWARSFWGGYGNKKKSASSTSENDSTENKGDENQ